MGSIQTGMSNKAKSNSSILRVDDLKDGCANAAGTAANIPAVQKRTGNVVSSLVSRFPVVRLVYKSPVQADAIYSKREGSQTGAVRRAETQVPNPNKRKARPLFLGSIIK